MLPCLSVQSTIMSNSTTMLRTAVRYGLVTGLLGGGSWILTLAAADPERRFSRPWWEASGIGVLCWLLTGLLIGACSARAASSAALQASRQPPKTWLGRVLAMGAWLLYRLLVGCFLGFLTTGVVLL